MQSQQCSVKGATVACKEGIIVPRFFELSAGGASH